MLVWTLNFYKIFIATGSHFTSDQAETYMLNVNQNSKQRKRQFRVSIHKPFHPKNRLIYTQHLNFKSIRTVFTHYFPTTWNPTGSVWQYDSSTILMFLLQSFQVWFFYNIAVFTTKFSSVFKLLFDSHRRLYIRMSRIFLGRMGPTWLHCDSAGAINFTAFQFSTKNFSIRLTCSLASVTSVTNSVRELQYLWLSGLKLTCKCFGDQKWKRCSVVVSVSDYCEFSEFDPSTSHEYNFFREF